MWLASLVSLASLFILTTPLSADENTPEPTVESILLDFHATEKMRGELAQSLVTLESPGIQQQHMDPQSVGKRHGCAVAVQTPDGPVFLAPTHLVRDASNVDLRLRNGDLLLATSIYEDPEIPIAVIRVKVWSESVRPLPLASDKTAKPGVAAFAITQVANRGHEVISRVHLLQHMGAPLARLWVSDMVNAGGFPMITPKKQLLALPFRILESTVKRTMTAGPDILSEIIGRSNTAKRIPSSNSPKDH